MSRAEIAIATMRALTAATTIAVRDSLTYDELERRHDALAAPAPGESRHCIVCRDPDGVRCCEYGRDF